MMARRFAAAVGVPVDMADAAQPYDLGEWERRKRQGGRVLGSGGGGGGGSGSGAPPMPENWSYDYTLGEVRTTRV